MKGYTNLDQSRKLADILPIESADMYWLNRHIDLTETKYELFVVDRSDKHIDFFNSYAVAIDNNEIIPAWSLTALLGLMPKLYEFENDPDDGGCQPNLCKGWDNNQWHIVYRSSIYTTDWYDDPIDAAFEMVCWLKENGKI